MEAPGGTLAASALVPTAGRPELIAACVRSIEACRPAPAEVVVVDQSDGGAVAAALAGTDARVMPCRGRGIALAMNIGLRAARHDVVLVTNDDCTVAPDWAAVAWRHLAAQPRGLVSGRVLPGGEGASVPSLRDDPEPQDFSGEPSFGALYAGNMALDRREALALGGFDERRTLRLAAEDNDFGYRWLRSGRPLAYEPAMTVWHHDWRAPDQLVRRWAEYARGQGALYAKHLHGGDRWILRRVASDLRGALRAELRGLARGEPRAADERRAALYWLPVGLVEGWLESVALARRARSGGSPSRRPR
jgi:GT2 family glycosyltransferase